MPAKSLSNARSVDKQTPALAQCLHNSSQCSWGTWASPQDMTCCIFDASWKPVHSTPVWSLPCLHQHRHQHHQHQLHHLSSHWHGGLGLLGMSVWDDWRPIKSFACLDGSRNNISIVLYLVCIHRPRFPDRSLARIALRIPSWSVSKCLQSSHASNWSPNLKLWQNIAKQSNKQSTGSKKYQKVPTSSLHCHLQIQNFQPVFPSKNLRKCSNWSFAMHGGFALWTWYCCCYFGDLCAFLFFAGHVPN